MTDFTHDVAAASWVTSANQPGCDFPIQNLPFGTFRRVGTGEDFRCGIAIGDMVLDLARLHGTGLLEGLSAEAAATCCGPTLNPFLTMGPEAWKNLRHSVFGVLSASASPAIVDAVTSCLVRQEDVENKLPVQIGDYTDYFTSIHHAINGGRLLDPRYQLPRNFQWMPIAYHGRASSIALAGQTFHRPYGQLFEPELDAPVFQPTRRLDFELELGVVVGTESKLGARISMEEAESHLFGICLLNDWSARDIQAWEMAPLGPFQSKNFATTVSPWIVTMEALAPFRVPHKRLVDGPAPLPHLDSAQNRANGALDIRLQALIKTEAMRAAGAEPEVLSTVNFAHQYWTVAQMVTHHASGGCNFQAGDLLGTGTISNPESENAGSMIELTHAGKRLIKLKNGESRGFVEDGDAIIFRGWCEGLDRRRIGFGTNFGTVLPAAALK